MNVIQNHRQLSTTISEAPQDATIIVKDLILKTLGEIAITPDRLNRPDLKFQIDS